MILFAASLIFAACGGSSTETTQDSTVVVDSSAVVDSANAIEVKTSDSTAVSSISAE